MNKINKKLLMCFFFFILFFANNIYAQNGTTDKSETGIGFKIGYAQNITNYSIKNFPNFNLFYDFYSYKSFILQFGLEYYQNTFLHRSSYLEYKGTEYSGNHFQLWKNFSLDAIAKFKLSKLSYLGLGVSLDRINVMNDEPIAYYSFRPDYYTDKMYYWNEKTTDNLLKFGIKGVAEIEPDYHWFVDPFLSMQFKMIFCGEKYGRTGLNTQEVFSVSIGFKYRF